MVRLLETQLREEPELGDYRVLYLGDPRVIPVVNGEYDDGYEALQEERVKGAIARGIIPKGTVPAPVDESVDKWETASIGGTSRLETKVKLARAMEIYAGMVTNMDHHFGRVVQYLEDIGELENTIVIFMSDNGPNPWFSWDYPANGNGLFLDTFDDSLEAMGTRDSAHAYGPGWASAGSAHLNAFKLTVAEGGIRVPLIIAVPGMDGPSISHAFGYVWDIMPTLLELAGVDHPKQHNGQDVEPMKGRSLVPLVSGEAEDVYAEDEYVAGELVNGKWIRQGPYKAVSVPPPYGDGEWELYNLEEDIGESNDLSKEMPDKLEDLIAAFDAYAEDVGIIPWEPKH